MFRLFVIVTTLATTVWARDVNVAFFLEWATPNQIAKVIYFFNIFSPPHPPSTLAVFLPSRIQSS